jgi:hypothetical protein
MISVYNSVLAQPALLGGNWLVTLGTQTTGTFTLTWNTFTTATIPFNASAATVLAALQALGGSGWSVTGSAGGPYTVITPGTPYGAVLTGSGALLTTPGNFGITPIGFVTGTHVGTIVDVGLYGNMFRSLQFVISAQTITDGTHTATVQECATPLGVYTAVDPGRVQGVLPVLTSTNSNNLFAFGVHHTLRYVQLVITSAGTTTGGLFSAIAVGAMGSKGPVARA